MKRLLFAVLALLAMIGALPASAAAIESPALVLARGAALHGANGVMFDRHDRLYIADALYEVDPGGTSPPRLIAENLGGLNSMDWGPDGFLYGPLSGSDRVVRINVDTGAVTPVAGGFGLPTAAKFDSRGRLYVVDQLRGEVVRADIATGAKTLIARLTP